MGVEGTWARCHCQSMIKIEGKLIRKCKACRLMFVVLTPYDLNFLKTCNIEQGGWTPTRGLPS